MNNRFSGTSNLTQGSMDGIPILSVTSGKGGVGKTTLVSHLAASFAQRGERVLILDADLGMANVDLFFGVRAPGHIGEVLDGSKKLQEIIFELHPLIHLIPGGTGLRDLQHLNFFQKRAIMDSIDDLEGKYHRVIMDTSPGLGDHVLYFNSLAQEVILVLTPDPSSFADAYALVKVLWQSYKKQSFQVVVNQAQEDLDGIKIFSKFQDVANRFLPVRIGYLGSMSFSPELKNAIRGQRLLGLRNHNLNIVQEIKQIADSVLRSSAFDVHREGYDLKTVWSQLVGQGPTLNV